MKVCSWITWNGRTLVKISNYINFDTNKLKVLTHFDSDNIKNLKFNFDTYSSISKSIKNIKNREVQF